MGGVFGTSRGDQARYAKAVNEMRSRFLGRGAGIKSEDLRQKAEAIRALAKEEESGLLDALVGISFHDDANNELGLCLRELSLRADKKGRKPRSLTREEIASGVAAIVKEKGLGLFEHERMATEHFAKVFKQGGFTDKYFGPDSLAANTIDLEYRTALRDPDDASRERTLNKLQADLLRLSFQIEDRGIRAENLLIWWMRKLLREQGIDHLVLVEHSTVSQDLKGGPDIVIMSAPWGTLDIQLKTFSRIGYTAEYQDKLVEKAVEKVQGTDTVVFEMDAIGFNELIALERDGHVDQRKRNKLLRKIRSLASGDVGKLFDLLAKEPKVDVLGEMPVAPPPRVIRRRARDN